MSFFERTPDTYLISVAALVVSALLTGAVRKLALSQGVLDLPNERSSHSKATPRGGGLAIVLTVTLGMVILAATGELRPDLLAVLFVGGGAVALVGYIDDRRPLPAGVRLVVHVGAALWAAAWLAGLPALRIGMQTIHLGWVGYAVAVLALVWTLNLFNFMDGIDGIAASEAVFVASCGALLSVTGAATSGVAVAALVVAAACAGFLLWNWPPAKIFMGDVGSGYLGYVIAVLALAAARDEPVTLWIWLILGGVFFVDATVTIVRRVVRGDRIYMAHRSHGYQWLARRWGNHRKVTVAVMMLNLIWLLPCAFLATLRPNYAVAIVVVALAPLVVLAFAAGSGRRENANSETATG